MTKTLQETSKSASDQTCDDCFKIICRKCGWEANFEETNKVQAGTLTACPVCEWKPGQKVIDN